MFFDWFCIIYFPILLLDQCFYSLCVLALRVECVSIRNRDIKHTWLMVYFECITWYQIIFDYTCDWNIFTNREYKCISFFFIVAATLCGPWPLHGFFWRLCNCKYFWGRPISPVLKLKLAGSRTTLRVTPTLWPVMRFSTMSLRSRQLSSPGYYGTQTNSPR